MSSRILVVTAQGEVRYLASESEAVRVLTIQPTGARGEPGATGAGVAAGGVANDILKKTSATNYATAWETPASTATANAIVRRDASGGAAFDDLTAATIVTTGFIATTGNGSPIVTEGNGSGMGTSGQGSPIETSGNASPISTNGSTSPIYTVGATSPIYTTASDSDIKTEHASASVKSTNFAAYDATAGAALRNSAGTAVLTWGVSGQNMTVTAGTAGTFNATSYTYGTGAAAAHRTGLGLTALATTTPGTGVATALAVNVGTAGAFVVNGGALGTPNAGTLTSCTGLPISTGVSGLGTGVATLLTGTPSGTGGPVGTTSPTISNPTASTSSSSSAALLVSGPTSSVDTLRIQGTTTASYSSIGFIDSGGTQRGSFGYAGTTAGSFANTTFVNAASGIPLTLGTASTERMRIHATSGGVTIGATTDAGATNLLVSGSTKSNAGFIYGTFTVSTFPSTTYLEAVVTDALTPVIGAAVAAGGSAKCKVMYNGSAKIVTAVL